MDINDDEARKISDELQKLRTENHDLKEQLENYIPRRRVRRVYKQLKTILEADIQNENKESVELLTQFIQKIEKEGPQEAGQEIKAAIERVLGLVDLNDIEDSVVETTYIDGEIIDKVISNIEGQIEMDLFSNRSGIIKFNRKKEINNDF